MVRSTKIIIEIEHEEMLAKKHGRTEKPRSQPALGEQRPHKK